MEITDREKVIAGLEDSLANNGCGFMDGIGELFAVSGEDLQNAIALLKEQEPRVIAFDEIDNYEVLWLEVLDVNTEDGFAPWIKTKSGHWFSPLLCSDAQPEMILATSDEYGKICRCWTSRPDEKRRAETPWE